MNRQRLIAYLMRYGMQRYQDIATLPEDELLGLYRELRELVHGEEPQAHVTINMGAGDDPETFLNALEETMARIVGSPPVTKA